MKTFKTLTFIWILMPSVALAQYTTLQLQPIETTGIEHEDIGVVEVDSDSAGGSSGNIETEFKVEQGEKANVDGDPDRPIVTGETDEEKDAGVVQYNESDLEFINRNSISVQAVEVRGWDSKKKQEFLANVKTFTEVQSGEDLENFAKGALLNDDNIDSIVAGEEMLVKYSMPTKFLGIFNSTLNIHTEVDTLGRIKVKYPWYGFFFKKFVGASELEDKVNTALPEVGDEVLVGFEHQAELLDTLGKILKEVHDGTN